MCTYAAAGAAISAVGGFIADSAAASAENKAKTDVWVHDNKAYDVNANLEDVQYLNNVQEFDIENDMLYQAMLNQWQDSDYELNRLLGSEDHKVENAIIEMHQNDYHGTQTGATAARLAMAPVMKLGMIKARSMHDKMYAVGKTNLAKRSTWEEAKRDQWTGFMDKAAFAPIHGHRPAAPTMTPGPSPAGMLLGVVGAGLGASNAKIGEPFI